jgi:hypothetical protein
VTEPRINPAYGATRQAPAAASAIVIVAPLLALIDRHRALRRRLDPAPGRASERSSPDIASGRGSRPTFLAIPGLEWRKWTSEDDEWKIMLRRAGELSSGDERQR